MSMASDIANATCSLCASGYGDKACAGAATDASRRGGDANAAITANLSGRGL